MPDQVPAPISTALSKSQERQYLLYLEKELTEFIDGFLAGKDAGDGSKTNEYVIKAHHLKNSYYRLLSHQLCQYYHLSHWNNQFNEILVSTSDTFDYKSLNEPGFTKLSQVAVQFQKETPVEKPVLKHSRKIIIRKDSPQSEDKTSDGREKDVDSTSADNISKIETERASKHALYLKIRQQIFETEAEAEDEEDNDRDNDRDTDGEDAKSTESEDAYEFSDDDNDNDNESNESTNAYMNQDYLANMYATNYASAYPPMTMPMGYTIPMPHSPQFAANPANPQYSYNAYAQTGQYSPQMAPYYYPQMMQSNNWMPPPYDKETERRLLNNPYIIIPENRSNHKKKSNSTRKSFLPFTPLAPNQKSDANNYSRSNNSKV